MVHALDKTRSYLRPNGIVLNVHDLPRPPRIEIHSRHGEFFAGYLLSNNDFEDQRLADKALVQVAEHGLFSSIEEHLFNYQITADTFAELQDLLSDAWDDCYLPAGTGRRIQDLLSSAEGEARIVLVMSARLTILRTSRVGE